MIVGCYSIDLYCISKACNSHSMGYPGQYSGKNESTCLRDARDDGWVIKKTADETIVLCPDCSKKKKRQRPLTGLLAGAKPMSLDEIRKRLDGEKNQEFFVRKPCKKE